MFGLGSFRLVDAFGLSSTQVESGSPSEQSREVLAHQRLRSVTSNKVAMLPVISTIKSTVPFGTVLFILFEMMIRPVFKLCLNQVRLASEVDASSLVIDARSVTSNLLRSHPVISTIKSTVPFGTVLFILSKMTIRPVFKLCLNQVRLAISDTPRTRA